MLNDVTLASLGSVERSATALVWDASGNLVEVPPNTVAVDYGNLGQGRSGIEMTDRAMDGARNILLHSEDLTQSGWFENGTAAVNPNQYVSPRGTVAMDEVVLDRSGTGSAVYQVAEYQEPNAPLAPSFFIDPLSSTETLRVRQPGGGAGDQAGMWLVDLSACQPRERITAKHPAVTVAQPFTAASDGRCGFTIYSDTGPATFGLWGCQLSPTTASEMPYIPSGSTPGERDGDRILFSNVNVDKWFSPKGLTLFWHYDLYKSSGTSTNSISLKLEAADGGGGLTNSIGVYSGNRFYINDGTNVRSGGMPPVDSKYGDERKVAFSISEEGVMVVANGALVENRTDMDGLGILQAAGSIRLSHGLFCGKLFDFAGLAGARPLDTLLSMTKME